MIGLGLHVSDLYYMPVAFWLLYHRLARAWLQHKFALVLCPSPLCHEPHKLLCDSFLCTSTSKVQDILIVSPRAYVVRRHSFILHMVVQYTTFLVRRASRYAE